ncbi:MAG: hypothetical protein Q4B58_00610 [Bacteroidales bacterium]|nr:hypothetical protein [Bacteroidales bacterium]
MNSKYLLISLIGLALTTGCSDEPLSSSDNRPGNSNQSGPIIDDNAPQPITLNIGGLGLNTNVESRGFGTVGDLKGKEENVWHGEKLFIYAVNRGAKDFSQPFVDADQEIPTFLKGGFLQESWCGEPASAPYATDNGKIEFNDSVAKYKYYPLNGAYNFMGYHLDDAEILSSGIAADTTGAIDINFKIDGSQDVMTAQARLTQMDTIRFIKSLIINEKLDSAHYSLYYDSVRHRLSTKLSAANREIIEKELTMRHYSSYSNRRDVMPNLNFKHELSRITFQVVGGDANAVVRLSNRPKIKMNAWVRQRYMKGDFFTHNGANYMVRTDMQDALTEAELFGNEKNKNKFLKLLNFSLSDSKSKGDTIMYKNEVYKFISKYNGDAPTWEQLETRMNNITSTLLKFKAGKSYYRGECVVGAKDTVWIVEHSMKNVSTWNALRDSCILFQQGVFVSKIELLDMKDEATMRLTTDSLKFIPSNDETASTNTFVLKQRPTKNFQYGDSLVELQPAGPSFTLQEYNADPTNATRVGESMMIMPGESKLLANIYITEYVDNQGNLLDDANMLGDHRTKVYKGTSIVANSKKKDAKFEAGKSYTVTITAFAMQGIEVNTALTAWAAGGSSVVDPEKQLFDSLKTVTMPPAFYGICDTVPGANFDVTNGKEWRPDDNKQTVSYTTKGVHWFAIHDGYKVTKWVNKENERDYLNPGEGLEKQLIQTEHVYKFSINISATQKKEFIYRLYYTVDDSEQHDPYTQEKRTYLVNVVRK